MNFEQADMIHARGLFGTFTPAPNNPKAAFDQFKKEQNVKFFDPIARMNENMDKTKADISYPLLELGMSMHGDDPVFATSVILALALDNMIPKDKHIADANLGSVDNGFANLFKVKEQSMAGSNSSSYS